MYEKKGWVVMVSLLTTPKSNLGIYTKVLHVDTLTTHTFLTPHPTVVCQVALRIA